MDHYCAGVTVGAMDAVIGPFDVFDCHHHVGDVREFLSGDLAGAGPAIEDERRQRLAIMDAGGVRQAAVIVGHGYPRPRGLADTRAINDGIAAYRDAEPGRFPAAVGVVEPLYVEDGMAEIDRCAAELRLTGLSFHARFQGISMDNPWVRRYVGRMAELGLVPFLHAMTESSDEALWKVALVAGTFPDVPMLVLDAFSTFEGTKEASAVADRHPNLLFDTSLAYNADFIELFARRFGADRVVFGTDLYSPPVGRRISHLLAQLLDTALSGEEKAQIVGGNARRLLGLGPT
ncbi:MAG: amidohydrolase family protein [Acidimicrobiales bacterium]